MTIENKPSKFPLWDEWYSSAETKNRLLVDTKIRLYIENLSPDSLDKIKGWYEVRFKLKEELITTTEFKNHREALMEDDILFEETGVAEVFKFITEITK